MVNITNIKDLIEESAIAVATVNEAVEPHCITVVFARVVSDNQLLITDNYMVETVENIKKNPAVCLAVWGKDWEKKCFGYGLKGTAEYFTDGKWHEIIKKLPGNKGEPCKGAILITISKIKKLTQSTP